MRTLKISAMLGLVLLLAVVARADKVTSDYDHTVNFANYKTYMWIHEPDSDEPFMKQRIADAVNTQLRVRGMRLVSEGADLAVGANLATEEKHTWETYYSGSDWGWGGGWATTEMRTYEVGTLTVDLFDAESHKIIWQGVGVDKISSKPEKETKDYYKQIGKMFKEFPR
jgi:Domain of unknown function (DUF4136)